MNKHSAEIDLLLGLQSEFAAWVCERWWFTLLEALILRKYSGNIPNILEPMNEFSKRHYILSPWAPIRFSGIQMIHVLGGFHRQSNPQRRDQVQWPQSQEAQLCSQTNTHPLREREKKNTR